MTPEDYKALMDERRMSIDQLREKRAEAVRNLVFSFVTDSWRRLTDDEGYGLGHARLVPPVTPHEYLRAILNLENLGVLQVNAGCLDHKEVRLTPLPDLNEITGGS